MNEITQGLFAILGFVIAAVYAMFCYWGGRSPEELLASPVLRALRLEAVKNRVWGRIVAPVFFSVALIGISALFGSFSWWFLLAVPAYFGAHRMGHGGNSLWVKILRRASSSLVRTACCLVFVIVTGNWSIYVAQVIVGLIITLIFGIRNPVKAPIEEATINFGNSFLAPISLL